MGCVASIAADRFPKQGAHLGQTVAVCFHYDTSQLLRGRCIRDDMEAPFLTVFLLEDERVVLATECHYTLSDAD